jgi:hypothetical protein
MIKNNIKKIFIILMLLFIPNVIYANFGVEFKNDKDKKMIYIFYWLDHPFESMHPANMAAGELGAFQSRKLSNKYIPGKYYVIWRDTSETIHEMLIDIEQNVSYITITTENWIFEKDE